MTDLEGRELGDALAEALGWVDANAGEGDAAGALWCYPGELHPYISGDDLLTWAGVGLIVEAMAARGYDDWEITNSYAVFRYRGRLAYPTEVIDGDVPTAVAQAALAALGGEQ